MYFYPKDDTSGCTTEALDFSGLLGDFQKLGIDIIGVSPDSLQKHDKFIAKHELSITLAADVDKTVIDAYGAWVEKSMYGRKYMGVERSTFLISADGEIVEAWRKVRVKGHAQKVLEAAQHHFA